MRDRGDVIITGIDDGTVDIALLHRRTDGDRATPSAIRWTWLFAGVFTLVALLLFTRHADFPYLYHTDEPSKTAQIIEHDYNFHHPLLLLRATEALVQATGTPLAP